MIKLSNALRQEIDKLKEDGNLSLEARWKSFLRSKRSSGEFVQTEQKQSGLEIPKVEICKRSLSVIFRI